MNKSKVDVPTTRMDAAIDFELHHVHRLIDGVSTEARERCLHLLEHASRVFVYGAGRSGLVARAFAIRLMHLGYSTYVIGETITAPVQKGDVVVLVSSSGETYPVVMTAEIAHNLSADVISITANPRSRVAKYGNVAVTIAGESNEARDDPQRAQLAPLNTLFEAATWMFLDGLVAELMERLGQTETAMRKRHATLE